MVLRTSHRDQQSAYPLAFNSMPAFRPRLRARQRWSALARPETAVDLAEHSELERAAEQRIPADRWRLAEVRARQADRKRDGHRVLTADLIGHPAKERAARAVEYTITR